MFERAGTIRGQVLGVVLEDGRRLAADLASEDPDRDLAELQVLQPVKDLVTLKTPTDRFDFLEVVDREPALGEKVWALTPAGVSEGVVLAHITDAEAGDAVEMDLAGLGPGASGGAVIGEDGKAWGVIRGGADESTVAISATAR